MINRTILQGRLTADPELRRTHSDVPVCSFTVAWNEKFKEREDHLFLSCSAWRGTGEFVNSYFRKGQEIAVEGRLKTEEWQDKDGNNRSSIQLTVDKAHFCGPKQVGSGGGYGSGGVGSGGGCGPGGGGGPAFEPASDEDLPF